MPADNNYKEILKEVCDKLNSIDSVKEIDVLNIKNSVEALENLVADSQAKLNFEAIKNKLEKIAFQVDSCNETLLKDLYNDINDLKDAYKGIGTYLKGMQNANNNAVTTSDFKEFQKQHFDFSVKANTAIYNEITALKENSSVGKNIEVLNRIEAQIVNMHHNLSDYIEQLASKLQSSSFGDGINNIDEIGAIMSDLNTLNQKNIKQTNSLIKDFQTKFENFQNADFKDQFAKISEIYDNLNMIHAWTEKVGLLNKSIENVYARLGANIDFDDVSDKIDIIYENISALNNWSMKIDSTNDNVADIISKLSGLENCIKDTKNIKNTITEFKKHFNETFSEDIDFVDLSDKIDIVYENLSSLNSWANKIDIISNKVDKIDSFTSEHDFSDDIENISDKVNEISLNIAKQDYSADIKNISDKVDGISLTVSNQDYSSDIQNISDKIDNISLTVSNQDYSSDIQNISDKVDDISLTVSNQDYSSDIQNISDKVDDINSAISNIDYSSNIKYISEKVDSISSTIEEYDVLSKIDLIYENINLLNEWVNKIDNISAFSKELDNKFTSANSDLNAKIVELSESLEKTEKILLDVPDIKDKLDEISSELNIITKSTKDDSESYIYTLLDIESDFLKLNKFLDEKALIFQELISNRTANISEILNSNTEKTTQDINSLKEKFEALNDDISSISIRTNKLILSADDANKEFKSYLDLFKISLDSFNEAKDNFNPEMKFNALSEKLSDLIKLMHNSLTAGRNLNNAFIYLAEWIDATGSSLNNIQNYLETIRTVDLKLISDNTLNRKDSELLNEIVSLKTTLKLSFDKINALEETFNNYKTDDFSEIKSLLTGIIVQLNTALTPDIDSLNERIDKLSEENNNRFTQLENLLQEKIKYQDNHISRIEAKFDHLSSKFDKLIDAMSEDHNFELKDILNFIAGQISSTKETLDNQQNGLEEVSKKLENFDSGINKIVSYIEED